MYRIVSAMRRLTWRMRRKGRVSGRGASTYDDASTAPAAMSD